MPGPAPGGKGGSATNGGVGCVKGHGGYAANPGVGGWNYGLLLDLDAQLLSEDVTYQLGESGNGAPQSAEIGMP